MSSCLGSRRSVRWRQRRRLTLLFRCLLLIVLEVVVNATLWMIAAIVFRKETRFLSLCLLAWTLGLRHALDADHISVIDNATRRIAACPIRGIARSSPDDTLSVGKQQAAITRHRRPVTCGLWFSLGHSTIVVGVICAVAISLGVIDRLGGISSVGGLVGASVSGATLFLFAVINSILLIQSVRATRGVRERPSKIEGEEADMGIGTHTVDHRFRGVFTRLAYPLFKLVDSPYKLYPIGVLFGLGFDTASSIALLGVAGATNTQVQADRDLNSDETSLLPLETQAGKSNASIILLALLFTAGMTLVDSLDSVLMINAYAPGELLVPTSKENPRRNWRSRICFFEPFPTLGVQSDCKAAGLTGEERPSQLTETQETRFDEAPAPAHGPSMRLSHTLTLLSIVLAFAISVITIMGLVGEHCERCVRAAVKQQEGNGGLEGRWWLFWQQANDASGIIGACIVGAFAAILTVYYTIRAALGLRQRLTNSDERSKVKKESPIR